MGRLIVFSVFCCALSLNQGSALAGTISDWESAAGQQLSIGDVTFTLTSTTLDAADEVMLQEIDGPNQTADYYLTVNIMKTDASGATLDYTVSVNTMSAPLGAITSASASANILPTPASVSHLFVDGANVTPLTTTGAAISTPILSNPTALKVSTTLNGSMQIHSFTDGFHVQVPEPSTLALVGLGLLGFVVQAVRRPNGKRI